MRSAQKVHTLRLGRLRGAPSLRSDIQLLLWAPCQELSERDVVGVDVTNPGAWVVMHRRRLVRRAGSRRTAPTGVQELDVVDDDFGGTPLLAVLALPRP